MSCFDGVAITRSTKYIREYAGDPIAVECDTCDQPAGKVCCTPGGMSCSRPHKSRVEREVELRPPDIARRLRE